MRQEKENMMDSRFPACDNSFSVSHRFIAMPLVSLPSEAFPLTIFGVLLICMGSGAESLVDLTVTTPPCPYRLSVPIAMDTKFQANHVSDFVAKYLSHASVFWRISWQQGWETVMSVRACPCNVQVPCLLKCCHLHGMSPAHCTHRDPVCPESVPKDYNLGSRHNYTNLLHVLATGSRLFALFNGSDGSGLYRLEVQDDPEVFSRWDADGQQENLSSDRMVEGGVGFCVHPDNNTQLSPWFCKDYVKVKETKTPEVTEYYPYGRLLAIAALLSALCVYASFPKLRNFHGKVVISHLASLLLGNSILSVSLFLWRKHGKYYCSFFGIGIQYFFLASFFWLSVMCVDIFMSFRNLDPVHIIRVNQRGKKFMICSVCAWGIPAIISAVTAAMEFIPNLSDTFIRPNFAGICWFKEKKSAYVYFFIPVGVTLAVNLALFVATSSKIFKLQREMTKWENRNSVKLIRRIEKTKKRFNLYLKLSLMMGVGRIIGFIFWLLDHPKRLFIVTDITEALQSVLIFITYVWKDEVILLIKKKISSPASQQGTQDNNTTDEMG
ncbi:probable G-protein coupled receptor Mth-like 3 [Ischnura elegans]|uniref:probable G-protein coupled receptor Mth-like 3 n=1 Tax=Ischnura elegans TaxID=197161 RepID=UPI001ED88FE5|nr:probable G-protein coupled receptor Mth-like 3 [Ischnura elegans]